MIRNIARSSIFLIFVFSASSLRADLESIGQVGKRWSEGKEQNKSTTQSYLFALHAKTPLNKTALLFAGPSVILDYYDSREHCESTACYQSTHYKIGIDYGSEFAFTPVTFFIHGRSLLHSRGRYKLSGRTKLRFPKSLSMFENGNSEGELRQRSLGFNVVSGFKWDLFEDLSILISFEMAYEKIRTEEGTLKIWNDRGDLLHLNSSLLTDWHTNNSSAIYVGLGYIL